MIIFLEVYGAVV